MGEPESPKEEVFNETEMERLMALQGDHCVLYDGINWYVTVNDLGECIFTFTLTPIDLINSGRYPLAFFYYASTGRLRFIPDDCGDLSSVKAFLNEYRLI